MNYLAFTVEHRRFLGFGLLLAFGSSFAQTLFIGLFGADLRAEFALSHGEFGLVYSLGTLAGAAIVMWLGGLIDRLDLRLYTVLVAGGLVGAFFLVAAAPSAAVLVVAIFALRTTGPTLRHIAITSMARFFTAERGKAVSIIWLGLPLGEAILPAVAVTLTAAIGWRMTWVALGVALAGGLIPISLWLLRGHEARYGDGGGSAAGAAGGDAARNWSHREVLRDPRFWCFLPTVLAEAVIIVSLLLHQAYLASSKGWSPALMAAGFVGFAVSTVTATLVAGELIDRLSAVRLLPYYNLPLAAGLLLLAGFSEPVIAFAFLILAGICTGANRSVSSALWSELYGATHLGAIRSVFLTIFMLATAAAPAFVGWLLDRAVSVETLSLLGAAYIAASTLLVLVGPGRPPKRV
ncbi:MAG TPA: MFS transporter [Alphaproteobacteria bacterium]